MIKTCSFCNEKINTKKEYIELKHYHSPEKKGKTLINFFHRECFRKKIEKHGDMNQKAEELYQKASSTLNVLNNKVGLLE